MNTVIEKPKKKKRNEVLVLNKLWQAVGVASVPRAVNLLCSEYKDGTPKARIIDQIGADKVWTQFEWSDWSDVKAGPGDDVIQSAHDEYKIPWLILLTRYDRMPNQKVNFNRREIWRRDDYRCQYCGKKVIQDECTIDHVIPRSQGGLTTWENCVLACYECNAQKADRLPEEAFMPRDKEKRKKWLGPSPMRLLSEPKKPKFSLFKGERKALPIQWKPFVEHLISEAYWTVPLESDIVPEFDDFDDV